MKLVFLAKSLPSQILYKNTAYAGLREETPMLDSTKSQAPLKQKPRLLEQVHRVIRRLHYSRRTEEAYVGWIKRVIYWSGKRYPATLGAPEVSVFLSHLATERNVAAATQLVAQQPSGNCYFRKFDTSASAIIRSTSSCSSNRSSCSFFAASVTLAT